MFFLIGSVLTFALVRNSVREAFLVGVVASALITNFAQGFSEGYDNRRPSFPPPPSIEGGVLSNYDLFGKNVLDLRFLSIDAYSKYMLAQGVNSSELPTIIRESEPLDIPTNLLETSVIYVYADVSNGKWDTEPVGEIDFGTSITYQPPSGSKRLGFVADDAIAAIDLGFASPERVCLALTTYSNDLLWALGFRRRVVVTSIRPILTKKESCSSYFLATLSQLAKKNLPQEE